MDTHKAHGFFSNDHAKHFQFVSQNISAMRNYIESIGHKAESIKSAQFVFHMIAVHVQFEQTFTCFNK